MTRLVAFLDTGRFTSGYTTPLIAALMKPVHEIDGVAVPVWVDGAVISSDGLRYVLGRRSVTAVQPAELPELTSDVRIAFALLCARAVYRAEPFFTWSEKWLSGNDRTQEAAFGAFRAGTVPACDRAYAAHWATMAAAFPDDTQLPAQTAALVAAHLFPGGTFDFQQRAEAAQVIAR